MSYIYLYSGDCEQHQPISQEMMGQICDLETVEPKEISMKICVMLYWGCGEVKASFLPIANLLKCIVAVLVMVEGLFSLFYCESQWYQSICWTENFNR